MENSIAISLENSIAVYSYHDTANDDLKYAFYDGLTWQIETVDSNGSVGVGSDIALDNNGCVHISYGKYDWPDFPLKYAYLNGSQWHIETVDHEHGKFSSIAIDHNNLPHISYYDEDNWTLNYVYFNENQWSFETVNDEAGVGQFTSISLDTQDHVHITYLDDNGDDIKYAYYNRQNWELEIVDSAGEYSGRFSSALDAYDRPHISYVNADTDTLKYAVIPDNELPTLDDDSSSDTGTTGDEFHFNISASDNYDVESVSVEWNHGESGENLPLIMNGSYWTGSINLEHSTYSKITW